MTLPVAVGTVVLFWWVVWPRLLVLFFDRIWGERDRFWERRREALCRNIGALIFVFTAAIAAVFLLILRRKLHEYGYESQLAAMALSAAITFTYGTLLPPNFRPFMHEVLDRETGRYDGDRFLSELTLPAGTVTPLFIAVRNVGVATWADFRVTYSFSSQQFEILLDDPSTPASWKFAWTSTDYYRADTHVVQAIRPLPLAAGEPQIARFSVRAPNDPGTYYMNIVVVAGGRFGETTRSLRFVVN